VNRFRDQVSLVTGAAGGIGAAAAARFAAEGARVVLVDVDEHAAHATATAVARSGCEAIALAADVGEPAQVSSAFERAVDHFGRIDIVFNNAGIAGPAAPVDGLDVAAFDRVLRVNLRGAFLVLQAALRAMIAAGGGGAIVNMSSSMAGWDVLAGGGAYAASKYGVLGLTRVSALEAAPYGIRVNAVCPGVVETALGIPDLEDSSAERDRFAARIPLRRVAAPEDVAGLVAFLASSDARHITGAAYLIDGGQTLQSWSNAPAADSFPLVIRDEPNDALDHGGTREQHAH